MQSCPRILHLVMFAAVVSHFATLVNAQGGYLPPPPPPIDCNQPYGCRGPGMFVNPNNCNSFYWCVDVDGQQHYKAYVFNCGNRLWFDERQMVCNYPESVSPRPRCADCWHSM